MYKLQQVDSHSALTKHLQILRSNYFQGVIIVFVMVNAVINASFVHKHDETDIVRRKKLYILEVSSLLSV